MKTSVSVYTGLKKEASQCLPMKVSFRLQQYSVAFISPVTTGLLCGLLWLQEQRIILALKIFKVSYRFWKQ